MPTQDWRLTIDGEAFQLTFADARSVIAALDDSMQHHIASVGVTIQPIDGDGNPFLLNIGQTTPFTLRHTAE